MHLFVHQFEGFMFTSRLDYLILNPFSAGIDFSRQNLTSVDVRF